MAYDESGREDRTYGNSGPGAILNTISFVGVGLGLLLIINRIYWRWKKGTPGIDDAIIVFAWLGLLALGAVTYVAVDYGYGRPMKGLTRTEASNATRMFYLYQIFYKLSLNSSKLSILTLYLRVFDTRDWFGRITMFLIFLVLSYTFSIILANIFICNPIHTYWNTSPLSDPSHHNAHCINVLGYWYASSLYNILSETLMLLSVLIRIWTLPSHSKSPILQFRQKVNLTIVLGLGVFTVITAILRVTTLNQAAQQTDRTGGTLVSTIWSSVEACLGLCVANLPMLRQLLRWRGWCGGWWFSSTADKSGGGKSRRRSEYTPAAQGSDRLGGGQGILSSSRRPTLAAELPPIASIGDIHMQREFHREVVTNDSGSIHDGNSISNSTTTVDIEAQPFRPAHVGVEFGCHSPSPPPSIHKSFNDGLITSPEPRAASHTPSIASPLRSPISISAGIPPVEPFPMVRIATEPSRGSLASSHSHSHSHSHLGLQLQPVVQAYLRNKDGGGQK